MEENVKVENAENMVLESELEKREEKEYSNPITTTEEKENINTMQTNAAPTNATPVPVNVTPAVAPINVDTNIKKKENWVLPMILTTVVPAILSIICYAVFFILGIIGTMYDAAEYGSDYYNDEYVYEYEEFDADDYLKDFNGEVTFE